VICNDEDLEIARNGLRNLRDVLHVARKTHSVESYRLMSKPFLLEMNERQAEVDAYLAHREQRELAA
jgi:hypothetical protein